MTMSPAVVKVLVDNFGVAGINNAEDDVRMFMTSQSSGRLRRGRKLRRHEDGCSDHC